MTHVTISVFQALTLLAEKYGAQEYLNDDSAKNTLECIKHIYLTGTLSSLSRRYVEKLLEDPRLANFDVSATKQDINEDPVRRYFESHLSHNTLATSLDELDILLLHENFHLIFALIHECDRDEFQFAVEEEISHPYVYRDEYLDALFQLNKPHSYQSLSPKTISGRLTPEDILEDRKQKLIMITKCMYASAWVNTQSLHRHLPLNIYNSRPESPYCPLNRGRKKRFSLDYPEQYVRPHTRGIMRSYMPLPQGDALFAEEPSNYSRPADQYTFIENSHLATSPLSIPKIIFDNQVTPFVGSISGVMLMQLKVMAILVREGDLPFRADSGSSTNTQLELYMKSFVSYMLYNAGGHSLSEFLAVLDLMIVQHEFDSLVGFSCITLKQLFQDSNESAFDQTMAQTIIYNNHIIQKKKLHAELKEKHTIDAPFIPIAIEDQIEDQIEKEIEDEKDLNYLVPLSSQAETSACEIARPEPDNIPINIMPHAHDDKPVSHLISVSSQSMFHAPQSIPAPQHDTRSLNI
jgi:hypothetical protein